MCQSGVMEPLSSAEFGTPQGLATSQLQRTHLRLSWNKTNVSLLAAMWVVFNKPTLRGAVGANSQMP
jgi:hypothetical protein